MRTLPFVCCLYLLYFDLPSHSPTQGTGSMGTDRHIPDPLTATDQKMRVRISAFIDRPPDTAVSIYSMRCDPLL